MSSIQRYRFCAFREARACFIHIPCRVKHCTGWLDTFVYSTQNRNKYPFSKWICLAQEMEYCGLRNLWLMASTRGVGHTDERTQKWRSVVRNGRH